MLSLEISARRCAVVVVLSAIIVLSVWTEYKRHKETVAGLGRTTYALLVTTIVTLSAIAAWLLWPIFRDFACALLVSRQRRLQNAFELKVKRYSPLKTSRHEIRVVSILPGETSDPIECLLQPVVLDGMDDIAYEALSYTWGSPWRPRTITLDKQPCQVRRNLYDALKRLRYPDRSRHMWIDALSINQFDNVERNEQVSMMRDIYERAAVIVVWLGETAQSSNLAFEFFEHVESEDDKVSFLQNSIGNDAYLPAWKAIRKLFAREYWHRIWVIQEIAVAPSVTVQCGADSVKWSTLVLCDIAWQDGQLSKITDFPYWFKSVAEEERGALQLLSSVYGPYKLDTTRRIFLDDLSNYQILSKRPSRPDLSTNTILELIQMYWTSKSSEPKDQIYAFIGLSSDCRQADFMIDYDLRLEDVNINLIMYLYKKTHRLDVLGYTGAFGSDTSSSLWITDRAPDFFGREKTTPPMPSKVQLSKINATCKYNAAGSSEADAKLERGGLLAKNRMLISGCKVGTIYNCGPNVDYSRLLFTRKELKDVIQDIKKYYAFANESLKQISIMGKNTRPPDWSDRLNRNVDEFWRVLVCDRDIQGLKAPDEWKLQFQSIIQDSVDQTRVGANSPIRPYLLAVLYYMTDRRLFVTTNGDFGVGPRNMEVDYEDSDEIIVFLGCNVPMVLSKAWKQSSPRIQIGKSGSLASPLDFAVTASIRGSMRNDAWGRYSRDDFVKGWAYLQNYMDGEALHDVERKARNIEQFSVV